jgi:hypothetical protein
MKLRNLLETDGDRVSQCSLKMARSAQRIIKFHNTSATTDPADAKPIRDLYLREVRILMRRCLKLAFYLLTHRKKAVPKKYKGK